MAYQRNPTWWLSGPGKGVGQVPGSLNPVTGDTYAFGLGGLGQTSVDATCADGSAPMLMGLSTGSPCADGSSGSSCPSGYNFNGAGCDQVNRIIGNPLLPVGSSATVIPGVSNTYVMWGAAALAAFLLLGALKK